VWGWGWAGRRRRRRESGTVGEVGDQEMGQAGASSLRLLGFCFGLHFTGAFKPFRIFYMFQLPGKNIGAN